MSDAILADLQRRVANMVRRGLVAEVREGERAEVRVRSGQTLTGWLPVAQQHAGRYRRSRCPLAVGDPVTILSECGDLRNGTVYPGANTRALPLPEGDDSTGADVYRDGAVVGYDAGAHEYVLRLPPGGRLKIKADVEIDGETVMTKGLSVWKSVSVVENVSAGGNVSDQTGTLQAFRLRYNGHTHRYDNNRTTDTPGNPF